MAQAWVRSKCWKFTHAEITLSRTSLRIDLVAPNVVDVER
jgi:hypothetical protein